MLDLVNRTVLVENKFNKYKMEKDDRISKLEESLEISISINKILIEQGDLPANAKKNLTKRLSVLAKLLEKPKNKKKGKST
jgi:hypothetical protein